MIKTTPFLDKKFKCKEHGKNWAEYEIYEVEEIKNERPDGKTTRRMLHSKKVGYPISSGELVVFDLNLLINLAKENKFIRLSTLFKKMLLKEHGIKINQVKY